MGLVKKLAEGGRNTRRKSGPEGACERRGVWGELEGSAIDGRSLARRHDTMSRSRERSSSTEYKDPEIPKASSKRQAPDGKDALMAAVNKKHRGLRARDLERSREKVRSCACLRLGLGLQTNNFQKLEKEKLVRPTSH